MYYVAKSLASWSMWSYFKNINFVNLANYVASQLLRENVTADDGQW